MTKEILETDDWKLDALLEWKPKCHSYNNWRANEYIDMFKGWKAAGENSKNLSESVIKEKARLCLQEGHSWRGDWEDGLENLVQICEHFYCQGFKDGEKI